MSAPQRRFGRPASMKETLVRGKEFTDAALGLDIQEVLKHARTKRNIGHAAADLSGIRLQREGDGTSKRLVFAAYDSIYDLMAPTLDELGANQAEDLFTSDTTHGTLRYLSDNISSTAFSKLALSKRNLHITNHGLELDDNFTITTNMATRQGCPYAKAKDARYFNLFSDRIVETYAAAHRNNMPPGWLDLASRSIRRR